MNAEIEARKLLLEHIWCLANDALSYNSPIILHETAYDKYKEMFEKHGLEMPPSIVRSERIPE